MIVFWDFVGHLKDIAAIITPIAIAMFGFYINKSIQSQNKLAERRSALSKQWADEFSKLASEIYNTALRVVFIYFQAVHRDQFVRDDEGKFFEEINKEIPNIALRLEEQRFRITNYIDLAPSSGPALRIAFQNLADKIREWFANKGGNADELIDLQAAFNRAVRDTHREILDLT